MKAETRVLVAWTERCWHVELIGCSSKLAVWIRWATCAYIVKCRSNVTPRFLADWEKGAAKFPTIRESGGGGGGGDVKFKILGADMISAAILSSFSFSLLLVIHNLKSWLHSCMDWVGWVHQAVAVGHIAATESHQQKNGEGQVVVDNIREGCSLQNKENRSGTDPCRTSQQMGTGAELQFLSVTV